MLFLICLIYKKEEVVYLFKIGDLVTCRYKGIHSVTDYNKPLRVVKLGSNNVGVRTLFGDNDLFWLSYDHLRMMDEKEILRGGDIVTIKYFNHEEKAIFLEYRDYSVRVKRLNEDEVTIPSYWILNRAGDGGIYV